MTTPPELESRHSPLAWLRLLGVALAGLSALTVIATLQGQLDGSPGLDHTRRVVVLVLILGCGPVGAICLWTWWRLSGRFDTAENFVEKPMALAPHVGPDPTDPERVFVDGGYAYQVQELPARAPLLLTRGSGSGDGGNVLFQILFEAATWFGSRALDRRWKVVVSRRLRAAGHLWTTLQVDLFDDPDASAARLNDVVTTWDTASYARREPLTRAQVRAARRRP
ncbi:MAG: hypothetical protein ACJ72E_14200 [Marmoricola sp.]